MVVVMYKSEEELLVIARSWLGTKFQHQGRIKKSIENNGGCDCLGLIIGVIKEAGITHVTVNKQLIPLSQIDCQNYSRMPDEIKLRNDLNNFMLHIEKEKIKPMDIGLFELDGRAQHLGFLTQLESGDIGMMHAYAPARKVVEHGFDALWRKRLVAVFRWPHLAQ